MSDISKTLIYIFIIMIIFGLLPIIYILITWATGLTYNNPFSGMMNHMGGMMGSMMFPMIFIWIFFVGIFLVGIIGVIYLVMKTETEYKKEDLKAPLPPTKTTQSENTIDEILRILKEDEKHVVKLIIENGGKMLQKDIRWEAGYTRLKTHRIINRLLERGIVKKRTVGNTNEIILEDWIMRHVKKSNK